MRLPFVETNGFIIIIIITNLRRFVKSKRSSICPNFSFLGQLLEYEKQLRAEKVLPEKEAGGKDVNQSPRHNSTSNRTARSPSSQSINVLTPTAQVAHSPTNVTTSPNLS